MKLLCPSCGQPFAPENINVQTDLALCKGCGQLSRLSELADSDFDSTALQNPPKGAWYRQTMTEVVIGTTTRSPIAFFLVPFMCVRSGGSLGGIYGSQLKNGRFEPFMSLFGLPFLVGSLVFGSIALMAVCGKCEVRLNGGRGVVLVGIGALGWKRPFDLDDVSAISEESGRMTYPGSRGAGIVLQGAKTRLRFGTNLNDSRRHFVLNALKLVKARKA